MNPPKTPTAIGNKERLSLAAALSPPHSATLARRSLFKKPKFATLRPSPRRALMPSPLPATGTLKLSPLLKRIKRHRSSLPAPVRVSSQPRETNMPDDAGRHGSMVIGSWDVSYLGRVCVSRAEVESRGGGGLDLSFVIDRVGWTSHCSVWVANNTEFSVPVRGDPHRGEAGDGPVECHA